MFHISSSFGNSKPHIAIVACMHGDERFGLRVFKELSNLKLKKGSLTFITANLEAAQKKVRYIEKDLNRSFPGKKNGKYEERLAYRLTPILKQFDIIIDLHSTNSNFRNAVIVTKKNSEVNNLLSRLPINTVLHISRKLGSASLIHQFKAAVSLEYGPNKDYSAVTRCAQHIKALLRNMDLLAGRKSINHKKKHYFVYDILAVPEDFIQSKEIDDFKLIKKGQILGTMRDKELVSRTEFYPIFVGRGRYPGYFGMMAKKVSI